MATTFAALEQRLNSAVLSRLSNATATLPGGAQVAVIFDMPGVVASVGPMGMQTEAPACTVASEALPADIVGQPITIGAMAFTVTAHEPDGTGMSRLWLLERAA